MMRTLRLSLMLLVAFLLSDVRVWALGEILGQTKEELKLQYDVAVHDLGDGRVTVEFTLVDEGRLKPLYAVELNIPGQEKDKGGGGSTDLAASLDMKKTAEGNRMAQLELSKEWGERAAIWLTTTSFDGKKLLTTRYHHVIPVAKYMKNPPAAAGPASAQWEQMFRVMYGFPRPAKDIRLEQLKALIDQGAEVNMAVGFDRMALEGETRADLRGTNWPLDIAAQQGRVDMVKLLLANGAKVHGNELPKAAFAPNQDDSFAMITALVQAGANVNARDNGFTALFWASYKGNKNSVKLLLSQPGLKLDETNSDGTTALMAAAESGHTEVAEMLHKAGANVGITNKHGETAASLAQKTLAKQKAIVEKQQAIISQLQSPPR